MKNFKGEIDTISIVCSHPTTPAAGDPVRFGGMCGVAVSAEAADGTTVVKTRGEFAISVKGINAGGNSAVAVGDDLYYTDGDTPPVSKKNTGTRIGVANGAVSSGATATINVLVNP